MKLIRHGRMTIRQSIGVDSRLKLSDELTYIIRIMPVDLNYTLMAYINNLNILARFKALIKLDEVEREASLRVNEQK